MAVRIGNLGQQITLRELRNDARIRSLDFRSCQYALSKRGWDRIWSHLSRDERVQLARWVRIGDARSLKDWMHDHPHLELGEKSLERLRKMASDLGIRNYSRLSKHRLIAAIKQEIEVAT